MFAVDDILQTTSFFKMHAYFNFGTDCLGFIDSPSVQPNRLCTLGSSRSCVANGRAITLMDIECTLPDNITGNPDDGNVLKTSFAKHSFIQTLDISEMGSDCNLQGCIRVTNELVYAVDSRSNVIAARSNGSEWSYSYMAAAKSPFSGGYAAVTPCGSAHAATAHYLSKQLQWMDIAGASTTRKSLALYNPTAVDIVNMDSPAGGAMAVAEGRSLSIWDHRMKENDGCTFRSSSGSSPLWTVLSKDNDVLAAGADRTVQVFDARTWRMRLNWRSPCKYDIVRLLPAASETRSRGVYVCGLDNEVLLCDVTGVEKQPVEKIGKGVKRKAGEEERRADNAAIDVEDATGPSHAALPDSSKLRISHHRGVRAESCWAGIDVTVAASNDSAMGTTEQLVGICDGGKLYVVYNADKLKYAE